MATVKKTTKVNPFAKKVAPVKGAAKTPAKGNPKAAFMAMLAAKKKGKK